MAGEVTIGGAKNSTVALIPAAILADTPVKFDSVPDILDVHNLMLILKSLNVTSKFGHGELEIDPTKIKEAALPGNAIRSLRASYYFMGALLGRFGQATVGFPGGDNIGPRPIDQHIKGFEALGAKVVEEKDKVYEAYKTIHIGDNPHSDCQLVGDRQRINMLWLSPRDQFRFSDQFDKFQRFIGTSIENSLTLGFLVNHCLYNSPFALRDTGFAQINSLKDASQGIFAPLFLRFSQYLSDTCSTGQVLLFLSREGYFLQKLYVKYSEAFQRDTCKNYYFLTSRRTASVAQIREYKDAKELLKTSFEGKASTFFSERFGLTATALKEDKTIRLPDNKQQMIETLALMAEPILRRSNYERETYLAYIQETLGRDFDWSKATLIDVGYAGTIQYYLMKILNLPLDGRYLVTEYNIKPLTLGGSCTSLYSFKTSKLFENTQLFLEAVTAAPYSQLICFEKNADGSVLPVYKEEGESCWRSAEKLQEFIYEYVELFGSLLKDISPEFDKELAETILSEVLRAGLFGENLKGTFTVYDGYCMDGEWVYDEKETRWVLHNIQE